MRKLAFSLVALLLIVAQPAAAQWTPDNLSQPPTNPTDVQYQGRYTNFTGWGVYVGPYWGSVGGFSPTSLYCVDFVNTIRSGDTWSAFATPLDGSDLSHTYLGNETDINGHTYQNIERYTRAAFAASLFSVVDKTEANWSALHGYIWSLMNPNEFTWDHGFTFSNEHKVLFRNFDPSKWYVLSDVRYFDSNYEGAVGQEFLVYVPEPATVILLLSGLLGIVVLAWRAREKRYA
jgi:hypothetical protein